MEWISCMLVGAGGALGAVSRYLLGFLPGYYYLQFPVGTMLINFFGSFLIGIVAGMVPLQALSMKAQLFLKTGFCGGFTTFSTFSLETVQLLEQGHWGLAGGYMIGSVLLCMMGVLLGKLAVVHLFP